jgi:hypothetical protein
MTHLRVKILSACKPETLYCLLQRPELEVTVVVSPVDLTDAVL